MTLDVAAARRDTPGCRHVAHFNNAGASLMPRPVLDAVQDHLSLESRIGGYEAAEQAAAAIDRVYGAVADLLNCERGEVAFVESATRAWGAGFYALPLGPGDRILTAETEYASNYIAFLQLARTRGIRVEPVPSDEYGQISVEALEAAIDDRVKLIALTHVPSSGGLVNPAAAVGRIARAAGVPYLLDACQSVGQLSLDVREIGCDMLAATGRKYLRAPRGTGFLYVRRGFTEELEPPMLDLRGAEWIAPDRYEPARDATRFETFEGHVAGKIGLGVAADYALGLGIGAIEQRVATLAGLLRKSLERVPGVTVHDRGRVKCGIVTFAVAGTPAGEVQAALRARGINVAVSIRNHTLLDMTARGLDELTRASVHYYNTEDEIERLCGAVGELA